MSLGPCALLAALVSGGNSHSDLRRASRQPHSQCELLQQTSVAPCVLGRSFGCDGGGGMWVANCRGKFRCGSRVVHCDYPPGRPAYNCSCGAPWRDDRAAQVDNFTFTPQSHPPPPSRARRRPWDYAVIGVQKGGTTGLTQMLNSHPRVHKFGWIVFGVFSPGPQMQYALRFLRSNQHLPAALFDTGDCSLFNSTAGGEACVPLSSVGLALNQVQPQAIRVRGYATMVKWSILNELVHNKMNLHTVIFQDLDVVFYKDILRTFAHDIATLTDYDVAQKKCTMGYAAAKHDNAFWHKRSPCANSGLMYWKCNEHTRAFMSMFSQSIMGRNDVFGGYKLEWEQSYFNLALQKAMLGDLRVWNSTPLTWAPLPFESFVNAQMNSVPASGVIARHK